jgi:hypothetical protein
LFAPRGGLEASTRFLSHQATGSTFICCSPKARIVGCRPAGGDIERAEWGRPRACALAAVQVAGPVSTSLLVIVFHREAGAGKVGAYLAAIPPVTVCMFVANLV